MKSIYFDYAATTPTDPLVVEAMTPFFFERFGNASSPHTIGREARKALEDARGLIAGCVGAQAGEMVLMSSATEANNHAVFGVARAATASKRGNHLIVSRIEHHSVLEPVEYLQRHGFEVTWITPDAQGRINPADIEKSVSDRTVLISLMHASNEIGTIQPVEEIGALARGRGIPFHVDAVQSVGHIPVDVEKIGADLVSFSAHKFYGPKGVGALYVRAGTVMERFLFGGDQESNRRASTQNVAGAVGMARAARLCREKMEEEARQQTQWRDRIIETVERDIPGVKVNGHRTERLPNNAHFSFENLQGEALLMSLDMAGIRVSMGSACTSGALEPSHVLRAVGLPDELAYGSLRVTLGRWTTEKDVDDLLSELPSHVARLRV